MRLGALAVVIGVVTSVALFVPFVALSYRRHGRLSLWRAAAWAAALVYAWAIWAYTLLPLPSDDIVCVGRNVDLFAFVDDLRQVRADTLGVRAAVTHPVVMQLVLNVLLFVPLGFFLRILGGRGILMAGAAGLGTSLLVELTQLTGVWGIYPCAYRVFDIDDLLTNTTGALVGSVLAFVVPRRHWGREHRADPDVPQPVTKPRRLVGMLCDWLGFTLVSTGVGVAVQAYLLYAGTSPVVTADPPSVAVGDAVALGLWAVVSLATGRTVGDLAVRMQYTGGHLPEVLNRLLRFLLGIGGYGLLLLAPAPWPERAAVFAVVVVAAALLTRRGRGLPGVVTGRDLIDSRTGQPSRRPPSL